MLCKNCTDYVIEDSYCTVFRNYPDADEERNCLYFKQEPDTPFLNAMKILAMAENGPEQCAPGCSYILFDIDTLSILPGMRGGKCRFLINGTYISRETAALFFHSLLIKEELK